MDYGTIEKLLQQYWDGDTSLEEEQQLMAYFSTQKVDERLKPFTPFFLAMAEERNLHLSASFDQRLEQALPTGGKEAIVRKLSFTWMRVAAAVVVLVVAIFAVRQIQKQQPDLPIAIDWSKYEPQDPQEALEKTKAAFALVSEKMNHGKRQTLRGLESFEKAKNAATN
jgi:hypothetical protein